MERGEWKCIIVEEICVSLSTAPLVDVVFLDTIEHLHFMNYLTLHRRRSRMTMRFPGVSFGTSAEARVGQRELVRFGDIRRAGPTRQ